MATSAEKAAQRNVIEYCVQLKMTPAQTFKQLQITEKYKNMSRALVFKWHKRFAEGWTGESDSKLGRPTEINSQIVNHVRDVIDTDRRLTVREISEDIGISKTSVHWILRETLGMSRVCARWVPRRLTEDEKAKRVQLSKIFLRRYARDPDFLDKIISVDETWLCDHLTFNSCSPCFPLYMLYVGTYILYL